MVDGCKHKNLLLLMVKMKMALPIKGKPIIDFGAVFVVLQTHASPNETLESMVPGAAICFTADEA
ncbi:hypothetical protein HRM2_19460 [Desulforapulum autotrophicum HRM2]|uniref:Uncharacterized protein n=1 Tax=Desulforapulum autotrophicum (strain ATCC 43914 / DSM 3382 / VKM B-1955 / HRM2) TaxID=177437 RepID=C0QCH0_DESAH|nr:hypothetical protein HRM2_19460 [Desulforapulum autotrophicum HRM2]